MAPTKSTRTIVPVFKAKNTRSKPKVTLDNPIKELKGKRKADSPPTKEVAVKRSALGDLTNTKVTLSKKVIAQKKAVPSVKTVKKPKQSENVAPPPINRIQTRGAVRAKIPDETAQKPKEPLKENTSNVNNKVKTRLSNEFEKTEDSLYSTALEEISSSSQDKSSSRSSRSSASSTKSTSENKPSNVSMVAQQLQLQLNLGNHEVPESICDFDKENWNDIFQVSHYAMDIFNYLKSREPLFAAKDYMDRQVCLTKWMRSLLVDWMVEIQESFELNHETLYLGVKLVDLYLSKMSVNKEILQLVGAAAMFVACKYDERIPPYLDDFLYICDGAYTRKELIRMEINLLKVCDFNLGIPISYRFLRRYARCAKLTMPILTLARFILEYSLMDYATVTIPDSKLACAALYLALRMKNISKWTQTLEFYTGYRLEQFINVVHILNNGLHTKPKEQLMTVRNKYSHKIFFEVAKTPLLRNEELE